jgi:hypothetical protein
LFKVNLLVKMVKDNWPEREWPCVQSLQCKFELLWRKQVEILNWRVVVCKQMHP